MSQVRGHETADDADPRTWAGYRHHRRARSTGTVVVLLDGEAAGLDVDGGRWSLMCVDHSDVVAWDRQADARLFMADPDLWCSDCRERAAS